MEDQIALTVKGGVTFDCEVQHSGFAENTCETQSILLGCSGSGTDDPGSEVLCL